MGFDLEPKNKEAESLHLPIGSWSMLRQGLGLLGADTSKMAHSTKGEVVDKETALDWGQRLQEGVE